MSSGNEVWLMSTDHWSTRTAQLGLSNEKDERGLVNEWWQ